MVNSGQRVKRLVAVESIAQRKLRQLEIAGRLDDLGGVIGMSYHYVKTSLELLPDSGVRLHETWQWTSGDCFAGR